MDEYDELIGDMFDQFGWSMDDISESHAGLMELDDDEFDEWDEVTWGAGDD